MPSHTMWGWVKNTAPHYASRLKICTAIWRNDQLQENADERRYL